MIYSNELVDLEDGLRLFIPTEALIKPTYEYLLKNNPVTPFPFWAKIWPASKAMSAFLQSAPEWIANKRVLEIGAGVGIPSFIIAKQTSEIIISDYSLDAVALIEKNIKWLELKNAKAVCIDWNDFPDDINAQTILLSDINYAPDQFEALLKLIKRFLELGSTIIITTPQRITSIPFAEAIQSYVKYSILQSVPEMDQHIDVRILILYL